MRDQMNEYEKTINRNISCDCYKDCISLYDDDDFKALRGSHCDIDNCGWREHFVESYFQKKNNITK